MKKCRICGEKFTPTFSSLQRTCSTGCAIQDAKKQAEKDWKAEKKEWIERSKTHGQLESELEREIRAIVRLIDKGCDCISCGAKLGGKNQAQAGHRFSVGGYNSLRFNLLNIFLQGVCCNKHKSGNLDGYDDGLIRTYGQDLFEEVKFGLRRDYPTVKLSRTELIEKTAIARQIVKELTKIGANYPAATRIALRRSYNERIGVYTKAPDVSEASE